MQFFFFFFNDSFIHPVGVNINRIVPKGKGAGRTTTHDYEVTKRHIYILHIEPAFSHQDQKVRVCVVP